MVPIRNAEPVARIVYPGGAGNVTRARVKTVAAVTMKSEVAKKQAIQEEAVAQPTQAPAPTAEAQESREESAQERANAVVNAVAGRRITERRVNAVRRRAPNVFGIVNRRIDHLRIGGLNHDRALAVLLFRSDALLRRVRQTSVVAGGSAQPLDGVHHVGLLRKENVAEVGGPLNVTSEHAHDIREGHQGLHAGVPVLLLGGFHELLAAQTWILLHPLLSLSEL